MKMLLIVLTFLLSNQLMATKPTVAKRTKKQRAAIMKLVHKNKDTLATSEKKIMENFKRDCTGFAYHKNDMDLQVLPIYRAFPVKTRLKVVEKNLAEICPANLMLAFQADEKHNKKIPDMTRRYLRRYKGNQYWPYTQVNEVAFFAEQLGKSCKKGDLVALQEVLCKFESQAPGDAWIKISKDNFKKYCTSFDLDFKCDKK